jgi:hypothetical protein
MPRPADIVVESLWTAKDNTRETRYCLSRVTHVSVVDDVDRNLVEASLYLFRFGHLPKPRSFLQSPNSIAWKDVV